MSAPNFRGGGCSKFSGGGVSNFSEYGQRLAGTHPTGMHSRINYISFELTSCLTYLW